MNFKSQPYKSETTKTFSFDYSPVVRDLFAIILLIKGTRLTDIYPDADELMKARNKKP